MARITDLRKEERDAINAIQADVAELHASFLLLTAKLDADGGVTDTDYAADCDPPALASEEITG